VNFKLYHSLGLKYPPSLDATLEEVAAELAAAVSSIAGKAEEEQGGGESMENEPEAATSFGRVETAEGGSEEEKLAELKERLGVVAGAEGSANGGVDEAAPSGGEGTEEEEEEEENEETKTCRGLFKGLYFFLAREVGLYFNLRKVVSCFLAGEVALLLDQEHMFDMSWPEGWV
jgi:pescadillo protein